MILFNFKEFEYFKKTLLRLPLKAGKFNTGRFLNQELYLRLKTNVKREKCLILGNSVPPDENLLKFSLLGHTLKKEKAKQIVALLPYLPYSRQDKDNYQESLTAAWVGNLFKASGIDKMITVDVHSDRDRKIFGLPITSLSPIDQLANELNKENMEGASIFAPDKGAFKRCSNLAAKMNITKIAFAEKRRTKNGIFHGKTEGSISSKVILHDDILDTGQTLISAAKRLLKEDVKEIHIAITHGLFTGNVWKALWGLKVKRIICTDSIPSTRRLKDKRIKVVTISSLLKSAASNLIK